MRLGTGGGLLVAGLVLVAGTALALALGRFPIGPADLGRLLWAATTGDPSGLPPAAETVIWNIRGPRILAAILVGAALAIAGAAFQGLFRNPLVSPDILGASSGAALGAVVGILFSLPVLGIQALAFAGGIVAVALVYLVGSLLRGGDTVLVLVLTGVVVGSLLGAGVGLVKYLADPYNQLPAMTFWLLGSLAGTDASDILPLLGPVLAGSLALVALRWRMNAMSLPEEEARALGVPTRPLRAAIVAAATLVTAASVAAAGIVGWVGLVVPHLARFLVGPSFPRLLPTAALLGGGYLLLIDTLARTLAPVEIPLGILTAVIGTPFFLVLLGRGATRLVVILEATHLDVGYRRRVVARGLDLALAEGEVLALLGPNGGGKTTLLKTLLELVPPLRGEVRLAGRALGEFAGAERARLVAYVPQVHSGTFAFTVDDMVLMGRSARSGLFAAPSAADRAAVAAAIERLGIAALAERPYTEISGGERQLALVARALAQEPRVLVLDEPTASLDFGNQGKVMRQIRRLAEAGLGVVFSTHDPNQALAHADRVMLIGGGTCLGTGPAAEFLTAERLSALYGAEVSVLSEGAARAFLPA